MATIVKKAKAKAHARASYYRSARQRQQQDEAALLVVLGIGIGIGLGIGQAHRPPSLWAPAEQQREQQQQPSGEPDGQPAGQPEGEPTDDLEAAASIAAAARKALDRGDIATAYPLWRRAMQRVRLPLNWFIAGRNAGESVQ